MNYTMHNSPMVPNYGRDFNYIEQNQSQFQADIQAQPQAVVMPYFDGGYPINSLPPTIRNAVRDVQRTVQAPLPLIANSAMGAVSMACQNMVDVKLRHGETAPVALNHITIADSGERKTAVDAKFMRGIFKFEEMVQIQHQENKPAHEAELKLWQWKMNLIEKKIKKSMSDVNADLSQDLYELMKNKPILAKKPHLVAVDVTPEALVSALSSWNSMGLISSEASMILNGRAAEQLPTLNAIWDGKDHSVLRKSMDSISIRDARLTTSLMIQEGPFNQFLKGRGKQARGNGFLARCMIAKPFSTQGTRFDNSITNESSLALDMFEERVLDLLSNSNPNSQSKTTNTPRRVLEMSAQSHRLLQDFYNDVEMKQGNIGYFHNVNDAASKTVENATRIAALFHAFEKKEGPITIEDMNGAIAIAAWHLQEFKRIFDPIPERPQYQQDAQDLYLWLLKRYHKFGLFTHLKQYVRQCVTPDHLRNTKRLSIAIACLEEMKIAMLRKDLYINKIVIDFNIYSHPPFPCNGF